MSKRNKNRNYELKSDAVDKLLKAKAGDVPEYSKEELEKYRSKSKIHISEPVKVLFLKAWFAGAVCYFILWGLGTYVQSLIDILFILSVVLGMVTDILTNNVIRFIEKTPGQHDKWLMFPKKGMASFFLNMVYAGVLIVCVYGLYGVINRTIMTVTGNWDTVPLGVEPVMFGVFAMAFDLMFVGFRNLGSQILHDAMKKPE